MSDQRKIIHQTKDQGLTFCVLGIRQDLESGGLKLSPISQQPLTFLRSLFQPDESVDLILYFFVLSYKEVSKIHINRDSLQLNKKHYFTAKEVDFNFIAFKAKMNKSVNIC